MPKLTKGREERKGEKRAGGEKESTKKRECSFAEKNASLNVEGTPELEMIICNSKVINSDSGKDHKLMLKPLGKRLWGK